MKLHRLRSSLPSTPLLVACAALVAAVLPLSDQVPGSAIFIFLGCVAARLFLNLRGALLPSLPVRLVVLAGGLAVVSAKYGSIFGLEAGLGVLLILVSLKLLEANSARDFQVLALLGFFLGLCNLFFSQDLSRWIFVAAVCAGLIAAVIMFHRGPGVPARSSVRLALTMAAQAVPLAALLFLCFPQTHLGFRVLIGRPPTGIAGLSEKMAPGSLADLALKDEPAFKAKFKEGGIPPPSALYWRGVVLWRCEGLTWFRGNDALAPGSRRGTLTGRPVEHTIYLEPHGGRWLVGLDQPAAIRGPNATFLPGGYVVTDREVITSMSYEVTSRPENIERTLPRQHLQAALQTPEKVSPAIRALVRGWRTAAGDDNVALKELILRYLQENNFSYSLAPGVYENDHLEEFLLRRRIGFCEHFAGAFATLMRLGGVPARVVVGYHGGEYNPTGQFVKISQADAHAWCEVWLEERGWQRVDPTNAIAPDRISSGMAGYLDSRAAGRDASGSLVAEGIGLQKIQRIWRETRMLWDTLAYQWDLRVMSYDQESQMTLLTRLGLEEIGGGGQLTLVVVGVLLAIAGLAAWLRHSGRRRARDPAARAFVQFCDALAATGVRREAWEGPLHFTARAASELPSHAVRIQKIGALYTALRYGKAPPTLAELLHEVRALVRQRPARRLPGGTGRKRTKTANFESRKTSVAD